MAATHGSARGSVANFVKFFDKAKKSGLCGLQSEQSWYMPREALEEYWTGERIATVLETLERLAKPPVDTIRASYRRVFSILVYIGRPVYITEFVNRDIDDTNLPFVEPTWPYQTNLGPVFGDTISRFCDEQWKFCPVEFHGNGVMHRRAMDSRQVLPFTNKEILRDDVQGRLYKVEVQGNLDQKERDRIVSSAAYNPLSG
jgi:hypothetical protein